MIIAAGAAAYSDETASLAAYLRASGQLTAGLALRALLCGQTGLFEATSGRTDRPEPAPCRRPDQRPRFKGFRRRLRRGRPAPSLIPAFQTALTALGRLPERDWATEDGALSLASIQAVLRRCETAGDEALGRLIPLLRRFETEAAREKGRRSLERMKQETKASPPATTERRPHRRLNITAHRPPRKPAFAARRRSATGWRASASAGKSPGTGS